MAVVEGEAPSLSFCLPTLNRAELIGTALGSILSETRGRAEVVVVDGGSTDNTEEVVRSFEDCFDHLIYRTRARRVGIDRDIAWMVSLATSDYCWLMSDDDRLEPGAFAAIMRALTQHPELAGVSVNYQAYDRELRARVRTVPAAVGGDLRGDTVFPDARSMFRALGLHLGYMPAQIVRRDLWCQVATEGAIAQHDGSLWLMTSLIGRMVQASPPWLYLDRVCVGTRTANDSFVKDLGILKRQRVTHEGFIAIVSSLFGERDPVIREVRQGILRDRVSRTIAVNKANGIGFGLQFRLFTLYLKTYGRDVTFWWKAAPLFILPNVLFAALRHLYLIAAGSKSSSVDPAPGALPP